MLEVWHFEEESNCYTGLWRLWAKCARHPLCALRPLNVLLLFIYCPQEEKHNSCVKSCKTIWTRNSVLRRRDDSRSSSERCASSESISSMNMTDGWWERATSNNTFTSFSLSPCFFSCDLVVIISLHFVLNKLQSISRNTHLEVRVDELMLKNVDLDSLAMHLA